MLNPTRPILRYHGGKWKMGAWIIEHFPTHKIYVEPYSGGASVLLRKPRVYAEVYNDMDGEIVNLFKVLRDPTLAKQLKNLIILTPFARDEFKEAYISTSDTVERARRTLVRAFMGFGSGAYNPDYSTGFRRKSFRSGTSPAWDWHNYPDHINTFVARLRGVTIENKPALNVIEAMDEPGTLFYVDPPYVRSTRTANGNVYRHEMTDEDHRELAAALHAASGYVVVSGYPSELYDEIYKNWPQVQRKAYADKSAPRTEVLWLSPKTAEALERNKLPQQGSLLAVGE